MNEPLFSHMGVSPVLVFFVYSLLEGIAPPFNELGLFSQHEAPKVVLGSDLRYASSPPKARPSKTERWGLFSGATACICLRIWLIFPRCSRESIIYLHWTSTEFAHRFFFLLFWGSLCFPPTRRPNICFRWGPNSSQVEI